MRPDLFDTLDTGFFSIYGTIGIRMIFFSYFRGSICILRCMDRMENEWLIELNGGCMDV